jgi:hypothetical protein
VEKKKHGIVLGVVSQLEFCKNEEFQKYGFFFYQEYGKKGCYYLNL